MVNPDLNAAMMNMINTFNKQNRIEELKKTLIDVRNF